MFADTGDHRTYPYPSVLHPLAIPAVLDAALDLSHNRLVPGSNPGGPTLFSCPTGLIPILSQRLAQIVG